MILVTVGLHNYGMERLIEPMDLLAAQISEKVFIQYGSSKYLLQNAEGFSAISFKQFNDLVEKSSVIVAHAASGTIMTVMRKQKPMVLVPRMKELGEAIDNHQFELAAKLEESGKAIVINEPNVENLLGCNKPSKKTKNIR